MRKKRFSLVIHYPSRITIKKYDIHWSKHRSGLRGKQFRPKFNHRGDEGSRQSGGAKAIQIAG